MSFEATSRYDSQLHGAQWRHLDAPVMAQCYVAQTWMTLPVTDVNDDTRAVRVTYDTVNRGVIHFILEPWACRDLAGAGLQPRPR